MIYLHTISHGTISRSTFDERILCGCIKDCVFHVALLGVGSAMRNYGTEKTVVGQK